VPVRELEFEWDEAKARSNLLKHKVSFLTAAAIFANERLERIDDRKDYGETRWIGLGRVDAEVYRIVYSWRSDFRVRIISAQKANRDERKPTIAKYSLSEVQDLRMRGKDPIHSNAPEAASLGEEFWKSARVVMPTGKTSVHLRLDSDVVDWFKARGKGHLTRMNAVLRAYVNAQERCA